MVIHTKKKAKLHTHEPKKASIKASNIYTVDRSPKIKGSKIATTENKKFRRSTIHPVDKAKKGMFRQYRAAIKESKQSIKTKNSSIKVVGAAGAQTALSQMEGGEEVRDAANIAYAATRPVTGTASRGAELFRRKALAEKRKRIKKVEAGKKLGYHLHQSHGGVYIFLIEGEIVVDGEVLKRRDGMGVYDTKSFELETLKDSHILLIEVPM